MLLLTSCSNEEAGIRERCDLAGVLLVVLERNRGDFTFTEAIADPLMASCPSLLHAVQKEVRLQERYKAKANGKGRNPLKKLLLLIWKALLVGCGGYEALDKLKVDAGVSPRRRVGVSPVRKSRQVDRDMLNYVVQTHFKGRPLPRAVKEARAMLEDGIHRPYAIRKGHFSSPGVHNIKEPCLLRYYRFYVSLSLYL